MITLLNLRWVSIPCECIRLKDSHDNFEREAVGKSDILIHRSVCIKEDVKSKEVYPLKYKLLIDLQTKKIKLINQLYIQRLEWTYRRNQQQN